MSRHAVCTHTSSTLREAAHRPPGFHFRPSRSSHTELQAFVEMGNLREAITAKENLNGKNLFVTHCNMTISYGLSDTLSLKAQNSNPADFTLTGGMSFTLSVVDALRRCCRPFLLPEFVPLALLF